MKKINNQLVRRGGLSFEMDKKRNVLTVRFEKEDKVLFGGESDVFPEEIPGMNVDEFVAFCGGLGII